MRVKVVTLYDRGRRLPRWREGRPGECGTLVIRESFDSATSRTRRTAIILDDLGNPCETVAPLMDATVLYVSGDCMTITGIERLDDERTGLLHHEYAQSWAVLIVAEQGVTG